MAVQSNITEKTRYIRIAAIIALVGNAVLAVSKIVVGILSSSGAMIGDGMDSSTDVLVSIITLIIVRIISKPADKRHPWGHRRVESITTAFLSFIIFFAGAQLIINSISNLVSGTHTATPTIAAIVVTIFSIVGNLLLAYSQFVLGKRADSAIIKANAKNMASDVLISVGVLIGFIINALTGIAHADSIIAMLIGGWIIKTAIGIFTDANIELMDGNKNLKSYHVIVDAVNSVEGACNPHRARMRCVSGFWDVSFDINVDPKYSISEAHAIASQVEKELKARLENVYDIMIHVEPSDDDSTEAFGLSEDDIINEDSE